MTLSASDGPIGSAPNAVRRIPSQSQRRFGTSSNPILSKESNLKRSTCFLDYNKFNTKVCHWKKKGSSRCEEWDPLAIC